MIHSAKEPRGVVGNAAGMRVHNLDLVALQHSYIDKLARRFTAVVLDDD